MIYDGFTYFNEDEILRIRFEELDSVVDYFIVVEATQTFTGKPKPLYFDQLPWIKDWEEKIMRVVVDFPEGTMTTWEREAFQRNQIMRALDDAAPESYIMISDADEVPRAKSIIQVDEPVHLDVTQYFWKFNWQVPRHCNQGGRPVLVRIADLTEPHELRIARLPRIRNAGWHFSFFGDYSLIQKKISSFSHTEMDTPEFRSAEHIFRCIEEGTDPFDRFPLKYVDVDETFPQWVQDNLDTLDHFCQFRSQNAAGDNI